MFKDMAGGLVNPGFSSLQVGTYAQVLMHFWNYWMCALATQMNMLWIWLIQRRANYCLQVVTFRHMLISMEVYSNIYLHSENIDVSSPGLWSCKVFMLCELPAYMYHWWRKQQMKSPSAVSSHANERYLSSTQQESEIHGRENQRVS